MRELRCEFAAPHICRSQQMWVCAHHRSLRICRQLAQHRICIGHSRALSRTASPAPRSHAPRRARGCAPDDSVDTRPSAAQPAPLHPVAKPSAKSIRDPRIQLGLPAQRAHHQLVGERAIFARERIHARRIQQLGGIGAIALNANQNVVSKISCRRDWQLTPYLLARSACGRQRSDIRQFRHVSSPSSRPTWAGIR